jgi:copper resistance protein C
MRKSRLLAVALALFIITSPSAAFANSLTATSPTAGSVLSVAPNAISMTTANPLLDQGNLIVVNDPNGVAVDDGSISVTGNNAVVGLKALTVTGVYTVNYTLLAANEAPVSGSFTFQFNAPSVVSTPSTPAVSPSTSNKPSSNPSTNSGADTFVYVLLLLAFLVFVFLIIYAKQTFGGKTKRSPKKKL